jgi:hypothetical protein
MFQVGLQKSKPYFNMSVHAAMTLEDIHEGPVAYTLLFWMIILDPSSQ